jgi:hypothetical protein
VEIPQPTLGICTGVRDPPKRYEYYTSFVSLISNEEGSFCY